VATSRPVNWPQAWSAFFYATNYYNAVQGDPSTAFSHTWSLAIEEQFYLAWPLLFLWWQRRPDRLLGRLVALIAAAWVYRAVLALVVAVDSGYIYSAFDTRFDALMIGCAMAVAVRRGAGAAFWQAATRSAVLPVLTVGLLCASLFAGPLLFDRYRDVIGYGVEALLTAVLIFQLAALSTTSAAWGWLNNGALQYLGRLSYSLYLYQQVTLHAVRTRMESFPVIVQLVAALLVTFACAAGSYYVIERPFLKLKERRARRSHGVQVRPSVEPPPKAAPTHA
jgi:peptidoglycan/LPS O-acetylase OafA/YrhL